MSINRGKQFEDKLQEQFERIHDLSIDRLYDVTTGYKNHNNICDFIVYLDGTLNYFECKAIHGNTLNFKSHIRDNQWDGLLAKCGIPGVNAGIICWFIDHDETYFIPIYNLNWMRNVENKKSFNVKTDFERAYYIDGTKKRVFFEYNLKSFLEEISYD